MITIPLQHRQHLHDHLVIVLEGDDFLKLKDGRPQTVDFVKMTMDTGVSLVQPRIIICYEKDATTLKALLYKCSQRQINIREVFNYLCRGYDKDYEIVKALLGEQKND